MLRHLIIQFLLYYIIICQVAAKFKNKRRLQTFRAKSDTVACLKEVPNTSDLT